MAGAVERLKVDTNTVISILHARRTIFATAVLSLALAGALLVAAPASAQESPDPNLVIFDDVTGPYHVKITQAPARAIVGTVQLIVEPTDAETGLPVVNALVRIFGTPPEEGDRQYSPGLNSPTDRTLYFGKLELEDAGVWTFDVEIDGPQGRAIAIAQSTINDRARSGSSTLIGTVLFFLISGAFVGVGFWLWLTSKKARRRRDAIRQTGGTPRRSSG